MGPRILIFDIETSPNISYTWGKWQQNVIDFIEEWRILCISWKWDGEAAVHYCGQDSFAGYYRKNPKCDLKVVEKLHSLFDEADIIIAHNGDKFDRKKANGRFLLHNMEPPSPYKTVDTLKVARRQFALNSNKLTDLGKALGLGQKVSHSGFDLWKGCMDGDPKKWAEMARYAKQDVRLLSKVYKRMLPWIENHPNYNLFFASGDPVCPNCGSGPKHHMKRGISRNQTRSYQRFQCKKCSKYFRDSNCLAEYRGVVQ